MMRLLPVNAFEQVFEPLRGKRVGFVQGDGNVGDALIEAATRQLFRAYGIRWCRFDPDAPSEVDEIVYGGGGNMGSLYPRCRQMRGRCLATGLPVTVFPQSFSSPEDWGYARVYVRERESLGLAPGAVLAPDLALGLDYDNRVAPRYERGLFLRRDGESTLPRRWLVRDPVRVCKTPEQYLRLAARYRHIVTDRLHFAIAGLVCGRKVTLLANSYHKNRSMYDTSLKDLGCEFAATVPPRKFL